MYLRSGTRYSSGKGNQTIAASIKSSEESVSNSHQVLPPIVEEETASESTSSMSMDEQTVETSTYSMAFNVRLAFVKTNDHQAQLYQDPMNQWVVKVQDGPTTFDPAPWVNYQGEQYMG